MYPNNTSTSGSADRLNNFYARFDDKDFFTIHQRIKTELQNELPNETPITISESEVYFILKSINTNKATGLIS